MSTERRGVALGVIGAMVMCGGLSLYLALKHPPYQTDESSQVGYVLVLMDGRLPSLQTDVPAEEGGRELTVAVGRRWPFSVPYIHTAINPPHVYAASIPTAALTSAVGVRAGPLLGVRLVNVFSTAVAVYLAYRLARELTGDRRIALVAVGLFSGVLSVAQGGALAYLEGPALLATTGVAWSLARFVRTRALRDATIVGLWCALAAAVRNMSMVYAAAAGAIALLVGIIHLSRSRWVGLAARLGGPAVVFVGWFWALNQHRYGDPTGASAVYDSRVGPGRSTLEVFLSWESFAVPLDYLLLEVTGVRGWWDISSTRQTWVGLIALALVSAAMLVVLRGGHPPAGESRPGGRSVAEAGRSIGAWAAVVGLSVVPPLMIANHVAEGGAAHPRYLMPVVPVLAVAVAVVLCRLGRWVPAMVVTVVVVLLCLRIPAAGRVYQEVPWKQLAGPLVGRPGRLAAVGLTGAGALALVVAQFVVAASPRRRAARPRRRTVAVTG